MGRARPARIAGSDIETEGSDPESHTANQEAPIAALLAATESGVNAARGGSAQATIAAYDPSQTEPPGLTGSAAESGENLASLIRTGVSALRSAIKSDLVSEMRGMRAGIARTSADMNALKERCWNHRLELTSAVMWVGQSKWTPRSPEGNSRFNTGIRSLFQTTPSKFSAET